MNNASYRCKMRVVADDRMVKYFYRRFVGYKARLEWNGVKWCWDNGRWYDTLTNNYTGQFIKTYATGK